MRIPTHLRRSKRGVLHLRLTVPSDLRATLGQREIKRSLKISDLLTGHRLAVSLAVRFGPYFEEFWTMIRKGYDPSQFDPTDPSTWPRSPSEIDQYKAKFNIFTGEAEIEAEPGNELDHRLAIEALKQSVEQAKSTFTDPAIAELVRQRQASIATERAILESTILAAKASQEPCITLKEAVALYETSLSGSKAETRADYMKAVTWFSGFMGESLRLDEITDEKVDKWREEVIAHYVSVRQKKQASRVAQGKLRSDPVAGLPAVEPKPQSVDKIISRAHGFLVWCQEKGYYPYGQKLPTANKTLMTHAERKKISFYKEFTAPELRKIFDPKSLLATKKPHEFWMPLLCLFTGARIGELAQMYHSDIYQNGTGCWVLQIRDREGFQTLKTNAACRTIPIHPQLIALGFLDYVADVKESVPESDRVFPYLRHDKKNGFGDVPSEAFARYLDRLEIYDEDKTAHSFRKTANNRLKVNGVDQAIRCQLVGHEVEGVNEVVYSRDLSIEQLFELLRDKLLFPELDFTSLHYRKGRFIEVLKSEMLAATTSRRRNAATVEADAVEVSPAKAAAALVKPKPMASMTPEQQAKVQRMENHLKAKAERLARANRKPGRPPTKTPSGAS